MRICCLLPSGAEILWELGLSDSVIGVSDLCDYPPEVLRSKPVVSRSRVDPSVMSSEEVEAALRDILQNGESPYELDYDWLARELPDIVFTQDLCHICEIDAGEVNQAVRGMSVQPRVVVLQPRTFGDILDSIVEVGEVCGVPERSEKTRRRLAPAGECSNGQVEFRFRVSVGILAGRHQPAGGGRTLDPRHAANGRRQSAFAGTRVQCPPPGLGGCARCCAGQAVRRPVFLRC